MIFGPRPCLTTVPLTFCAVQHGRTNFHAVLAAGNQDFKFDRVAFLLIGQ
jgi:hypothetical protein